MGTKIDTSDVVDGTELTEDRWHRWEPVTFTDTGPGDKYAWGESLIRESYEGEKSLRERLKYKRAIRSFKRSKDLPASLLYELEQWPLRWHDVGLGDYETPQWTDARDCFDGNGNGHRELLFRLRPGTRLRHICEVSDDLQTLLQRKMLSVGPHYGKVGYPKIYPYGICISHELADLRPGRNVYDIRRVPHLRKDLHCHIRDFYLRYTVRTAFKELGFVPPVMVVSSHIGINESWPATIQSDWYLTEVLPFTRYLRQDKEQAENDFRAFLHCEWCQIIQVGRLVRIIFSEESKSQHPVGLTKAIFNAASYGYYST